MSDTTGTQDRAEPATVTLSQPLKVIGKEVAALTLRPPNGNDLMAVGAIIRFRSNDNEDTSIDIVPSAMGKMIARLASIPMRSVEWLPARDFQKCSNAVLGFLGETTPSPFSIDTSNAPGSGAETSLTPSA